MASAFRISLLAVVSAAVTGCSGGGGGGTADSTPPTIVAAAFLGSGGVPVPGDELLLFLSEEVVGNGSTLDDSDLALPAGASLGTVAGPPTAVNSRTVRIVLGPGVSLSPGTTTLAFGPDHDALQDLTGNVGNGGSPVTITAGDFVQPIITLLTLNAIESQLNGTGAAGGTLQAPRFTFTIDVSFSDSAGIDADKTQIAASVTVAANGVSQPAGTDLVPFLDRTTVGPSSVTYSVPTSMIFPTGNVTLTAFVVDNSGMPSEPSTFGFLVRNLSDDVRPFETRDNASQVWFLDLSRDIESFTVDLGNMLTPVEVNSGANGTPDLEDLLEVLGLLSTSQSHNATVMARLRDRMAVELDTMFGGANITVTYTAPGTFPANQTSVPYGSHGFSQICIGGSENDTGDSGILGVAIYDPHNDFQNDNCLTDFQSAQRLGIFVHTVINDGIGSNPASLFQMTFRWFAPDLGGTPIGTMPGDDQRLADPMLDDRAGRMNTAIVGIARFIAVVVAHECGHSMGLVMNGAMPGGLYGGHPLFGGADSHISTPDLFPPGSTNVMSAALSYQSAVSTDTAFNTLNRAYLRERVLYDR